VVRAVGLEPTRAFQQIKNERRTNERPLVLQTALRPAISDASTELQMPSPMSMRLPDSDIAIIDRAAALRGRSRTDFVRDAAVRAAEEVLLERSVIRMDSEAFEAFKAAISAPPHLTAASPV